MDGWMDNIKQYLQNLGAVNFHKGERKHNEWKTDSGGGKKS